MSVEVGASSLGRGWGLKTRAWRGLPPWRAGEPHQGGGATEVEATLAR